MVRLDQGGDRITPFVHQIVECLFLSTPARGEIGHVILGQFIFRESRLPADGEELFSIKPPEEFDHFRD